MGIRTAINESNLAAVSKMVERFSGKWVAANQPILGADVFTQTAGIHADGDVKGGLYETRLSPERFDRKRSAAPSYAGWVARLAASVDGSAAPPGALPAACRRRTSVTAKSGSAAASRSAPTSGPRLILASTW